MENQIQVSNHSLNTPLNGKEGDLAKIIWNVNLLMNYPLSDNQIEAWAKSINELRPNQDLNKLKAIINMMKTGSAEFNARLGIQNIFLALKKYDKIKIGRRDNSGYYPNQEPSYSYYYEDDITPYDMEWLVDKEEYELNHLNPTIEDKMVY